MADLADAPFLTAQADELPDAPFAGTKQPKVASGIVESLQAGYQGSATGLAFRGKLPDVVLDPQHAKWYEKALSSVGQMVSEAPEMVAGAALGGAAGTAAGGPVGTILGGGAGAFGVPAAIRQSLIEAYKSGTVDSSGGFLNSAKIVLKETGKESLVGALTFGAGGAVRKVVGAAIGDAAATTLGKVATGTAGTAAEVGTMVVAPAALDGHLPEPEDFLNAAIVVGFAKGAIHLAAPATNAIAGKLQNIYARTGIRPEQVVADAKADPKIADELTAEAKPEGEPTAGGEPSGYEESRIPEAYRPFAEADLVANAMPVSPKIADFVGNMEGKIPDAKTPGHVNYKYVEAPEDLQTIMAAGSRAFAEEIADKRAAPKSWDETLQGAREKLAAGAGVKVDDVPLDEHVLMKYAMLRDATIEAKSAAKSIADKRANGEEITEEDSRRQTAAAAMVEATLSNALGRVAEVGRALNVVKAARQITSLAKDVKEMRDRYGEDPALFSKMLLAMDTPEKMGKFLSKVTVWEKVIEAWKAGILSGPVTHMANLLGNTTFMAMRPIVDLTASAIGKVTGAEERVSVAEPFARVLGNLQGAKDALLVAGETLKLAYEQEGIKGVVKEIVVGSDAAEPGKTEQFRKAIGGTLGDIVRLPFRALSVADEFFKTMNAQGERYSLATRQALKEGFNLQTREFRERVSDLVQNDADIAKSGDEAALRFTFNTPLGEVGQKIQALVRSAPILQPLVPFIRTPANIFKEMTRMTPLAPLLSETRAAWEAGGAERAKAAAEIMMGTAIGSVVASYVFDGSISGQGSPDPGKRKVASAAGWQPYSININGKWYSYQRLQPVGTLMGMAADLAEVWDHVTEQEGTKAATMLSVAFANAVTQQTFLQGITSIVQVLADPQRYGPRFVEQYAGSVVPAILAQPTTMYDPVQREVNGILDAVKARIPGLRQGLLAKRDYLGEEISTKERLGGMSPIQESTESTDKVRLEAYRLGVSAADAPKKVHLGRGTGKLGDVEITPEQRNAFTEVSGHLADQILQPIVSAPSWDSMPDLVKKRIYQRVFTVAHKNAAISVFPPEERAALVGQISERVQEELRPQ